MTRLCKECNLRTERDFSPRGFNFDIFEQMPPYFTVIFYSENLSHYETDPDLVYTLDFYQHILDLSTFKVLNSFWYYVHDYLLLWSLDSVWVLQVRHTEHTRLQVRADNGSCVGQTGCNTGNNGERSEGSS